MSLSPTINVSDLTNQEAVHRVLLDVRNHGTSYSLIQDGVEVAKVVPANGKNGKVSDEVTQRRLASLKRIEALSKEVAELWCTDETAVEAVANCRR